MTNPVTRDRRHFEDLYVGEVIDLGHTTVSKEMIITFAREFDPLPFHLDENAAKKSLLGGLASSGWQTGALSLRILTVADVLVPLWHPKRQTLHDLAARTQVVRLR